jgi:uncharacterized membrane protein YczE
VIFAGCVLFGFFMGRWWALLAALWLGVSMSVVIDPWEVSELYVGVVWAIVGIVGIALGVAVRKLARGVASNGDHNRARAS